ncbi:hypothetical protein Nepgr_028072 [Nepenthes gracilis]|uniref:Uncharacterized protein n=1 Tax=Nepenthes gracilis TaxID=150966 RepID=A0AAD3TBH8_NEPGR|nr:hypothetical protein Nepgr_028072 [Nepenthes gracilis]
MKRQSDMAAESTAKLGRKTAAKEETQTKRMKQAVDQKQKVVKDQERRDDGDQFCQVAAADGVTADCYGWASWLRSSGLVVDEQMSWGAMWFPSWDVEYQALYADVWDVGIWDFD